MLIYTHYDQMTKKPDPYIYIKSNKVLYISMIRCIEYLHDLSNLVVTILYFVIKDIVICICLSTFYFL